MLFDPNTLLIVTAMIVATIGILLLFTWAQNRVHGALAIWGAADLLYALAVVLVTTRGKAPDIVSVWLVFAISTAAYTAIWAGARVFSSRPVRLVPLLAGPAVWSLACAWPPFFHSSSCRVLLVSGLAAAYTLATVRELWRDDGERLMSRYPMLGCLLLHASLVTARAIIGLEWTLPQSADMLKAPWMVAMAVEPMILVIVGGFLQLSMAKERTEFVQRRVAATDALTGVASRRAFLAEGEQRLDAALKRGGTAVVMLFDLDRFKLVNDNHGHSAGDHMLQAFAAVASKVLRRDDLFGRIGGEEFAALLVDASLDSALGVAERCRAAIEALDIRHHGVSLRLTVSVGVSAVATKGGSLETLLGQADRALYEAKSLGRNCVQPHKSRAAALQLVA